MPAARRPLARPPFRAAVRDALRLRCPNCRQGPVLERWPNKILPKCAVCGLSYHRESGYYIGGMIVTYGLTLLVVIPVFLISIFRPISRGFRIIRDWRCGSSSRFRCHFFSCRMRTACGSPWISGWSHGGLRNPTNRLRTPIRCSKLVCAPRCRLTVAASFRQSGLPGFESSSHASV